MMNIVEIKQALENPILLVDTREHDTSDLRLRLETIGWQVERKALCFGDYSIKVGDRCFDGEIAIERKMSIDEICGNFGTNRNRFCREFERAKAAGARVYILIENGSYEKIIRHQYRSRLNENALLASVLAFMARYDCRVIFCKKDTAPMLIKNILYREAKERLENDAEELQEL